jgi:hypothetical protein
MFDFIEGLTCNNMDFKHLDGVQLSRCEVRAMSSVVFEKL